MYRRRSRQCCAAMLIVSVCLRLCMFLGLDEKLGQILLNVVKSEETAKFLLYLETGQVVQTEKKKATVAVVKYEPPQPRESAEEERETPPEPELPPEPVKTAAAEEITVTGGCTYTYDKASLLRQKTTMELSGQQPQILIIHSHTTEAYSDSDGLTYTATSPYRTLDETRNMLAVGDALAQALEQQGVAVLHDRSVHDYPDYNVSYWSSLQSIRWWQQQYPQIQMVIDIHRDAVEDEQGRAVALCSEQQGEQMARLMLVVGTDEGGLEHPNWQENLANALKLQSVLMGEYPGLCRNLDLRTERFNQHVAPGAILVEVGTNGNTLTQAKASVRLLADAVAKLMQTLEQNGGSLEPSAEQ